ncbi:MAG: right-handed parallel beta-helix repeat-containing protein [Chthoniobacter sp.]
MPRPPFFRRTLTLLAFLAHALAAHAQSPSVAEYDSVQAAVDANPGKMVFVPAGDYSIAKQILINSNGGGLYGPGRIVQTNPEQPIVRIERAKGVQLRDLTLTRAAGRMDSAQEGVTVRQCAETTLENVRVIDNRSISSGIDIRESSGTQVRGCLVENYMRISIDDRTRSPLYGYAFRCIDGTGIDVEYCEGTLIQNCRVVEHHLSPTPAMKEQYGLGQFTKKNPQKGTLMSQEVWDAGYVNNWHQGSAIVVSGPRTTTRTQLLGNQVENAAQGLDLHCDQIIVADNIVSNCFIGMKAMHGARNVLIIGNQFIRNDLWSIGLMPGTASGAAQAAHEGVPAQGPNTDGGSIIAHNIISDFGYGDSAWIWGPTGSASPIRFDHAPLPENPALTDVIVQGNILYDTGRDQPLVDGVPKREPPRYKYAVRIEATGTHPPQSLHFLGNIFHPGTAGVSNVELAP